MTASASEKRIPDTTHRGKVDKLLNRLLKRHDLQPPMLNRFTGGILIFWASGTAATYALSTISDERTRLKIGMLYSWSSFLFDPKNAAAFKNPAAWAICLVVLSPVLLQMLIAMSAARKALFIVEANKLAKQQGRKHPSEILDRRQVKDGIPLGEYKGRRFGIKRGADAGHVLVAAPTRAGKGLHLTGTLETWHGPAVVIDPKREQLQRTSGDRAQLGPVYCIPQHGLDILQYFDANNPLDLQELFTTLLQTWQDKDPIFSQKAYAVFEAARDQARATGEHMLKILARWANTSAPEAITEAAQYAPGPIAKFTDGNAPDELNRFTLSAWGTFTAKFSTVAPHVDTISRGDIPKTWAEQDATIYICYPLDQAEAAGGLLSVMITALMKGQQRAPEKNYTLFAMDELRATRLHGLDTKLATVGGYGITILAYLQQLSQLRDVYGHDAAASIIGNFHHQIFYPTRDNESAEYVSRKFGTEIQATRSYGSDEAKASYSQRTGLALEPSMVNTLPPTTTIVFTDDIATIAQRVNPFTNRKTPAAPPPPITVKTGSGTTIYDAAGRVIAKSKGSNPAAPAPAPAATRPITPSEPATATKTNTTTDSRSEAIEAEGQAQPEERPTSQAEPARATPEEPQPVPATMAPTPSRATMSDEAGDIIDGTSSSTNDTQPEEAQKEESNIATAEAVLSAPTRGQGEALIPPKAEQPQAGSEPQSEPQQDQGKQADEDEEIYF